MRFTRLSQTLTILTSAALLGAGTMAAQAAAASQGPHFGSVRSASIPADHMLDVGVTDYDDDGRLDLFTTNHKFQSVLLRNEGSGNFGDVLSAVGLSPTPGFPGVEDLKPPVISGPGLYLYMTDSHETKGQPAYVHIRAVGVAGEGRITFGGKNLKIRKERKAEAHIDENVADQSSLTFNAERGGVIDVSLRHADLPIAASFSEPRPQQILVGARAVPAATDSFPLTLRDRHGFAFADLGGDADTDLFAVSGGLGGGIKLPGYKGKVEDELFVRDGATFRNESVESGLVKGACRGREAAAVDVNGDGALDLFEGCDGGAPRIYLHRSNGTFERTEAPHSIATTYRWADLRGDSRPELLAAESNGIAVYAFGSHGPKRMERIRGNARNGQVSQFAVADFDADGRLDVLAVARTGNTLLRNLGKRLREVPARASGLPGGSVAASFVDYDNDGRLDLDLVPQGLMHRTGGSHFERTGKLNTKSDVGAAITTWLDLDNDGRRDPVIATAKSTFSNRKHVRIQHNLGRSGHWLEVDLRGREGNSEALGARVAVKTGRGWQYGFVGQSDDSRFSQGHYRVYFGLGRAPRVASLEVRWPDGSKRRYGSVAADRVMRLTQGG